MSQNPTLIYMSTVQATYDVVKHIHEGTIVPWILSYDNLSPIIQASIYPIQVPKDKLITLSMIRRIFGLLYADLEHISITNSYSYRLDKVLSTVETKYPSFRDMTTPQRYVNIHSFMAYLYDVGKSGLASYHMLIQHISTLCYIITLKQVLEQHISRGNGGLQLSSIDDLPRWPPNILYMTSKVYADKKSTTNLKHVGLDILQGQIESDVLDYFSGLTLQHLKKLAVGRDLVNYYSVQCPTWLDDMKYQPLITIEIDESMLLSDTKKLVKEVTLLACTTMRFRYDAAMTSQEEDRLKLCRRDAVRRAELITVIQYNLIRIYMMRVNKLVDGLDL